MKKYIYITILSFAVMFVSCTDDLTLEEISVDPNNPVTSTPALLTTSAQASILGRFGVDWDRYAGTFVQTFAGNHATGVRADQYDLQNQDFTGSFTNIYQKGFRDLKEIIEVMGPNQEAWGHVGIAKVMTATGLGFLTDIYGDLPWSEALDVVNFTSPAYDSQEQLYDVIFTMLQEAIVDLNKTSLITVGAEDVVFGGDLAKWKATANLLLARYNNHLSKKDPAGSATKALAYVDAAKASGLTSNEGNYNMNYNESDTNFLNPWYNLFTNNLIIASENFVNLLLTTNDPRGLAYWDRFAFPVGSGGAIFPQIVGKPNGLPTGGESYSPVGPNTYYGKQNSPVLIATYFELLFIEAEAAMRSGNTSRAATAHNTAITASMDMLRPTILVNGTPESDITDYLATFASETAGTISMAKIMEEKYKAMFTMNLETWVDLRRHDFQYPSYLSLPFDAKLSEFPRRGLYPQSELTNNEANVPSGQTMTSRLWWDN
jgi:hypothetical protein